MRQCEYPVQLGSTQLCVCLQPRIHRLGFPHAQEAQAPRGVLLLARLSLTYSDSSPVPARHVRVRRLWQIALACAMLLKHRRLCHAVRTWRTYMDQPQGFSEELPLSNSARLRLGYAGAASMSVPGISDQPDPNPAEEEIVGPSEDGSFPTPGATSPNLAPPEAPSEPRNYHAVAQSAWDLPASAGLGVEPSAPLLDHHATNSRRPDDPTRSSPSLSDLSLATKTRSDTRRAL